jgi:hypothetical protein
MTIAFSWINHLADATLAADTAVLPAANLLKDHLCDKWRSGPTTSATFTFTLAAMKACRLLAFFGSNYTEMMTWRLRLSNVAVGDSEVYDSGVVSGGAVMVNKVADGELWQAVMMLPAAVDATFGQIDIADAGGGSYRQAGALWLGDATFSKFGRSWGAKDQLVDPTEKARSIGGQLYTTVRDAARQVQFSLDFLSDEEVNTWVRQMDLTVRKSKPFVMVPEPNLPYQNAGAIFGTLVELPGTTRVHNDIRSRQYQIEESL